MERIIVQNLFGSDPAGRDRQAIERNVPNQLAPSVPVLNYQPTGRPRRSPGIPGQQRDVRGLEGPVNSPMVRYP